ncbi:hypothetical protein VN97_g2372 [Penicillium thymicola]|uniref:Uncharacterized protein n=1 Tax=Penicillium thymicola TaxID=293382 RepID=A0AAI9TQD1_PENTH|nr:hypothetical protein VN97_g2372 [Penicillium thymicola]
MTTEPPEIVPIVLKPKPATVRLVDVVDREGVSRGVIEVVEMVVTSIPIVLKPKPATVDGRSRWMIEVVVTSLPIVLKPKPATIRLVVIELDDRGRWMIKVDSRSGGWLYWLKFSGTYLGK